MTETKFDTHVMVLERQGFQCHDCDVVPYLAIDKINNGFSILSATNVRFVGNLCSLPFFGPFTVLQGRFAQSLKGHGASKKELPVEMNGT